MNDYVEKINASGISIYDVRPLTNPNLYIPTETLQEILNSGLVGFSVKGMPLRTRSKAVKSEICRLLGYPVPSTFKRTRPRFFGQNFEAFVQSALNVQIWNEEVDLDRRYVFVKVSGDDLVTKVKVISGAELIGYDKTGTLTHKYQALMPEDGPDAYASEKDTSAISELTRSALENIDLSQTSPCLPPRHGELLPIRTIYEKLLPTIGLTVKQLSATQERNRGAELHKLVCEKLGFSSYEDNGSYPDILNQLIEIKLQTSRTIDLGLHSPQEDCVLMNVAGKEISCKDIRYVIFAGEPHNDAVKLSRLFVVTGEDFPAQFIMVKNKSAKRQLPLPPSFFD